MQFIENRTFDEIRIGDTAELVRTLARTDIELFALMSTASERARGDLTDPFRKVLAHGMWGGGLISALLGTQLPGPGTVYLDQNFHFHKPIGLGDTVTVRVTVREKDAASRQILFDCECVDQSGDKVLTGEARVIAPTIKVRRPRVLTGEVQLHEHGAYLRDMIDRAKTLPAIRAAIIHPCDEESLGGALKAMREGLIVPVLVGPRARVNATAQRLGEKLDHVEIVDVRHSHAAALKAVELVRAGAVEALMKGALHTDEVMEAVVRDESGLKTERRISHVFVLDTPHYPKPLFVTDAAINIYPTLEDKRDIIQNAIELAHALALRRPKVAILSAVETVYPKIHSTVEAAALCKMADRGQITGGIIDGPLAFDNAISRAAAESKHIVSEVAGDADILVAPDLETGNAIAKQLVFLAGAEAAGLVLGARVPIMLTSRADSVQARVASAALARLFVHYKEQTP